MARFATKLRPGETVPQGMAMIATDSPEGARCACCGKPAVRRWGNSWRKADVCDSDACGKRETHWVGNSP